MTSAHLPAKIEQWVAEPLAAGVNKALERLAQTEDVQKIAVLPDVHLARNVCVGVAFATDSLLFPEGVGGDIGCGMSAIRFHCEGDLLSERKMVARLMTSLYERIPIIKHPQSSIANFSRFESKESQLSHETLRKRSAREGLLQLGTLGRGNHFIEFQEDEGSALWLMVHSGSRAMGQAIQTHHLNNAERSATGLGFLRAGTSAGQAYLNDVRWALEYAAANRAAMMQSVIDIMATGFGVETDRSSLVLCHHNFVERERIGDRRYWVHRKGVILRGAHEGADDGRRYGHAEAHLPPRDAGAARRPHHRRWSLRARAHRPDRARPQGWNRVPAGFGLQLPDPRASLQGRGPRRLQQALGSPFRPDVDVGACGASSQCRAPAVYPKILVARLALASHRQDGLGGAENGAARDRVESLRPGSLPGPTDYYRIR